MKDDKLNPRIPTWLVVVILLVIMIIAFVMAVRDIKTVGAFYPSRCVAKEEVIPSGIRGRLVKKFLKKFEKTHNLKYLKIIRRLGYKAPAFCVQ